MPSIIPASLAEALRLTRAGSLGAATERIQAALGLRTPAPPPASAPGDVIDLKLVRRPAAKPGRARAPGSPPPANGGRFLELRHQGSHGALDYRLYLPKGVKPGMPLLVMLHGCTQTPEDFAAGTAMNALADEHGLIVAYPGQPKSANAQRCWNWFRPGDQARDGGEPALIAGIAQAVAKEYRADGKRIYVAGLSAGGAAAAIMAAAYPELFAAVGIHSGLASGCAQDLPSALMAMKRGGKGRDGPGRFVPLITFHGDGDKTVAPVNARAIVDAAAAGAGALTTSEERGESLGGRAYTRTMRQDQRGRVLIEEWTVHGSGHAWSGGSPAGSYTDPAGPDASRAMLRFFLKQRSE